MLQRVEPKVGEFCYLFVRTPDSKYATGILRASIQRIELVGQQTITAGHSPSLRPQTGSPDEAGATKEPAAIDQPVGSDVGVP